MNIQPTSQNNPNFGNLYTPKKLKLPVGDISKKQLLEMPLIRDNIKKFDIFFKPEVKHDMGPNTNTEAFFACGALSGMGILGSLTYYITKGMEQALGATIFGGAFAGMVTPALAFLKPFRQTCFDYQVFGQKQYADGTKIKTQPFSFWHVYDVDFHVNTIIDRLKDEDRFVFMQTVTQNYPENGVFDAKAILKILQNKVIKNDFADGEAFNYKIDINGQYSLLIKFSELSKSEANTKEYDKIISIIKSTPNVDFYQQDAVGISILENILNMENDKALDLIKDVEFEHTNYLDSLFNIIKDKNFKEKVKKLKIKFKDPVKILQTTRNLNDFKDAVLVQLNSPFCDSQKVGFDIWKRAFLSYRNQKDVLPAINRILYNYIPENVRIEI